MMPIIIGYNIMIIMIIIIIIIQYDTSGRSLTSSAL